MDKDAYYFPHFCNARHDRKLKRARKELGIEAYGIFFMLLEVLREQQNFRYPMEDIDLLADEFGSTEQKVRVVICNYGLFDIDELERFFSPKFIEYMTPYIESKERNKINGIRGNLIKYNYGTRQEIMAMSDDEILSLNDNRALLSGGESGGEQPSDRNKRRGEEKKVKDIKGYQPPSKSDLIEYFSERGDMIQTDIHLEAENFINHYEERDWKNTSGKKITEWKRQAGTWNNNYQKFNAKRLQQKELQPAYYQEL